MFKFKPLLFFLLLFLPLSVQAQEKKSPRFAFSANTMGLFLGAYGGCAELKIIPRLSADIWGYYSAYSIDNNGYQLLSLAGDIRYYFLGKNLEGWWLGLGGGIKSAVIRQNSIDYQGVVPMLYLITGYKVLFGRFFIEPYGGYSFGLGQVNGITDYKADASVYGANMGFIF